MRLDYPGKMDLDLAFIKLVPHQSRVYTSATDPETMKEEEKKLSETVIPQGNMARKILGTGDDELG